MVRKNDARGTKVDWAKVEKATEYPRTYEITLPSGGIIFKMYKKSEMDEIMKNKNDVRNWKWKKVKLVGIRKQDCERTNNKPEIRRNESMYRYFY